MVRLGWGSGKAASKMFESPKEETMALQEAITQAAWTINDDILRSQTILSSGTTPFHKLGYGATIFWQAVLGFDKELMVKASAALSDAETVAAEYKKYAQSSKGASTAYHSPIYPDAAEYAICEAQAQLLGAILGVLKESWLESLAGLNKLRKAYFCVQGLIETEKKYLVMHPVPAQRQGSTVQPQQQQPIQRKPLPPVQDDDDDSDDEFFDADDDDAGPTNGHSQLPGSFADFHIDPPKAQRAGSVLSSKRSVRSAQTIEEPPDFRLVTTNPIDIFVHSSINMCWGIVQILLSFLPPAFRHILSMFSFRGDRDNGLRILWENTNHKDNIFGAISCMVVLLYFNIGVSLADILPEDTVPAARLDSMLAELRRLYPGSQLWINEEARIAVVNKELERAVQILTDPPPGGSFEEIQGIRVFEKALNLMFLHRFQECADTFLYCITINRWSHGMYYFLAAACHFELYRDHKRSNPALAQKHADTAMAILKDNDIAVLVKRKALMGQQLPFDAFIQLKLEKWEARAKARGCSLIDAIGVSPLEEFNYFWTGYRRMSPPHAKVSYDRLTAWEATPAWADEPADERASSALLKAICLRNMGDAPRAQALLASDVLCYTPAQIKACTHPNGYVLPVAHYEKGVCLWQLAGGEHGERSLLRQAREEVDACWNASGWCLEERMTVKLMAARSTFEKMGM